MDHESDNGERMIPAKIGSAVCDVGTARRRARSRRLAVGAALWCAAFAAISYHNYDKGIFYYDEGYNLLEARFVYHGAKLALGYLAAREREGSQALAFRDYVKSEGKPDGQPMRYGKPLHTLILAAGLTASRGELWGPYAAVAAMAAGVVVLTFLVGRLAGSWRSAIASALLLPAADIS